MGEGEEQAVFFQCSFLSRGGTRLHGHLLSLLEASMRDTGRTRQTIFMLVVGALVVGLSLLCAEMAVRYLVAYDADGICRLSLLTKNLYLKPFRSPVNAVNDMLEKYRSGRSYLMYDSTLGWVQRPGSTSENGLYHASRDGVRAGSSDEETPARSNSLRVILLGDSYTHGDEVPFEQTWGAYLQKKLTEAGIPAEIVNLGAPGYGMDQAYLRWKMSGAAFHPDLVVFGFQPENVKRNLNILRMFYHRPSRMPLTKPRFILDGRHLEAINVPTVSPDELFDLYAHIERWENRRYEYFYRPADYEEHIWLKSKLVAAVIALVDQWLAEGKDPVFYAIENEPSQLALAILNELRSDVERQGAAFLVAAVIPKWNFQYVRAARPLPYQDLLEAVKQRHDTVETAQQLYVRVKNGDLDELFAGDHYSAKANEIVAEVIAEAITQRQSTKPPSRGR